MTAPRGPYVQNRCRIHPSPDHLRAIAIQRLLSWEKLLGRRIIVELLEPLLGFCVFHLDLFEGLLDTIQALLIVRLLDGTALILSGAEILDLLAAILDLGQAKRS